MAVTGREGQRACPHGHHFRQSSVGQALGLREAETHRELHVCDTGVFTPLLHNYMFHTFHWMFSFLSLCPRPPFGPDRLKDALSTPLKRLRALDPPRCQQTH